MRAYGGAFVGYARDELGFKTEITYNLLASDISGKWDWGDGPAAAAERRRRFARSVGAHAVVPAHDRARLQRHGHALCGVALCARSPAAVGEEERAELKLYRGGHMFYIDPQSRKAFTADARTMYAPP